MNIKIYAYLFVVFLLSSCVSYVDTCDHSEKFSLMNTSIKTLTLSFGQDAALENSIYSVLFDLKGKKLIFDGVNGQSPRLNLNPKYHQKNGNISLDSIRGRKIISYNLSESESKVLGKILERLSAYDIPKPLSVGYPAWYVKIDINGKSYINDIYDFMLYRWNIDRADFETFDPSQEFIDRETEIISGDESLYDEVNPVSALCFFVKSIFGKEIYLDPPR